MYDPGKIRRLAKHDELYRHSVIDQYKLANITNGSKLLVLFLYNSHDEMRLTRMHPDCFMVDATHGTNNERKESFTVAATDGNNKGFNECRAFIPNQQ